MPFPPLEHANFLRTVPSSLPFPSNYRFPSSRPAIKPPNPLPNVKRNTNDSSVLTSDITSFGITIDIKHIPGDQKLADSLRSPLKQLNIKQLCKLYALTWSFFAARIRLYLGFPNYYTIQMISNMRSFHLQFEQIGRVGRCVMVLSP